MKATLPRNLGLILCAFSYAGQISLVVTADATGFPDIDVLMEGMERDREWLFGGALMETREGAESG